MNRQSRAHIPHLGDMWFLMADIQCSGTVNLVNQSMFSIFYPDIPHMGDSRADFICLSSLHGETITMLAVGKWIGLATDCRQSVY